MCASWYHNQDMPKREGVGNWPKQSKAEPPPELSDYLDHKELHLLLSRLPAELRTEHLVRIQHLEDNEATGYLYALHEKRGNALRESQVSDESIQPYFTEHSKEIWSALESHVFTDVDNHIGAGTTARIKRFDLSEVAGPNDRPMPSVAVKYLVTPTEKTLSVSGEHDLILELEQLQQIELAELEANGPDTRIRVPHPYFFYRKGKIQCYAMELIDGINLEQGRSNTYSQEVRDELREAFRGVDRKELFAQLNDFFDTMHSFCVHGDVKPRNLMASRDGHIYVIDFGQSLLANRVTEKSADAFGEIKDMEKKQAEGAVRFFLDALYKE